VKLLLVCLLSGEPALQRTSRNSGEFDSSLLLLLLLLLLILVLIDATAFISCWC